MLTAPCHPTTYTSIMTLKNAAFIALLGMVLLGILLLADFLKTVSGIMRDLVPMVALVRSSVYLLACLSLIVFFYVFHKRQA